VPVVNKIGAIESMQGEKIVINPAINANMSNVITDGLLCGHYFQGKGLHFLVGNGNKYVIFSQK
jgi:hypothetical protein